MPGGTKMVWSIVYLISVSGMLSVGLRAGAVVAVLFALLGSAVGPVVAASLGATETGMWLALVAIPVVLSLWMLAAAMVDRAARRAY